MQTALLFFTASAAGAGRSLLFLLRGDSGGSGRLLIAGNRSLSLFSLFLSADRTLFLGASAAACAGFLSLFSAHGTVAFGASATAAEGDTATHGQAAQQAGNAHPSQNLFHFFCIHSFLLVFAGFGKAHSPLPGKACLPNNKKQKYYRDFLSPCQVLYKKPFSFVS